MATNEISKTHALVIEDSRIDSCVLEAMLEKLGCLVDCCDDSDFSDYLDTPYDIIFIDINMPAIDGFSLTQIIRQSSLAIKIAPIIAVSAMDYDAEQIEQCMENGLDGYVEKPIPRDVLSLILEEFLIEKNAPSITNEEDDKRFRGFYKKRSNS